MTASINTLSGSDWEDWANQLLSYHYGPTEYQRVPDRDRGDAGIDGFSRENGHAYQAYGCEEPISTAARYAKQRDKMTDDIAKFINNGDVLKRLFGTSVSPAGYYLSQYTTAKTLFLTQRGRPPRCCGLICRMWPLRFR